MENTLNNVMTGLAVRSLSTWDSKVKKKKFFSYFNLFILIYFSIKKESAKLLDHHNHKTREGLRELFKQV